MKNTEKLFCVSLFPFFGELYRLRLIALHPYPFRMDCHTVRYFWDYNELVHSLLVGCSHSFARMKNVYSIDFLSLSLHFSVPRNWLSWITIKFMREYLRDPWSKGTHIHTHTPYTNISAQFQRTENINGIGLNRTDQSSSWTFSCNIAICKFQYFNICIKANCIAAYQ